jgi:hypothetical protein
MKKILIAVVGLGLVLGLLWLGLLSDSADRFQNKYKKIQLDMSEKQVDQILAGYVGERRELAEYEKEEPPNLYGQWKLKRKALFLKTYYFRPRDKDGDFYVQVYFDDDHSVVGHLLWMPPKNEFNSKCQKIQFDMTEEQVDQILAGYPSERRDPIGPEQERALWPGGKHIRKASFVKVYDCKPRANDGDFYMAVYFDDTYLVVGKVVGEYIS